MESLTIRISRSTHEILRDLAAEANTTMTALVDEAIQEYRRKKFWEGYHAAYAALRADPVAWAELQHESDAWDSTLTDGLEAPSDEHRKRKGKPLARRGVDRPSRSHRRP
jgi:hypothetical protein